MVRGPRPHAKINGYDLGVIYVPSHRHENLRLKPEMAQNQKFTMIHNFKPAIIRSTVKKFWKVDKSDCITTRNSRVNRRIVLPAALRERLQHNWSSILMHYPFSHFIRTQFRKHGKHHRYKNDVEYLEEGLRHGNKYLRGGKYDLMRLMRKRGYIPGYRYSCRSFVKAVQQELGHSVLVTFKYSEGVKYLDEISSLYDLNSKRHWALRDQTYDRNKYFHLEDFSRILKGTRLIEASKKLMSMRVGVWGRKNIY